MTSATRRFATIPLLCAALGLVAFGIVRGLVPTGPGHGVRLIVAIDPPLDAAAIAMAERVARERLEGAGSEVRVLPAGEQLVIEIGGDDPELARELVALLERTAALELRSGETANPARLDGRMIRHAETREHGVAIEVADASALAHVKPGVPITFVFDGQVKLVATPDRVVGTKLHVPIAGPTEDAALEAARSLVVMIEAGAVHPLHVVRQAAFARATGFLPRAWPFFALSGVLLLAAALLWRRR